MARAAIALETRPTVIDMEKQGPLQWQVRRQPHRSAVRRRTERHLARDCVRILSPFGASFLITKLNLSYQINIYNFEYLILSL